MGGKTLFLNCLESILISVCPRGCDSQPRWRGPCQQKQCAVCIPNAVCCIPTDVMKGFITCRILQCVSGHFRAGVLKLRKGSDLNGTRTVLQHGRLRLESNDVALAHEYQGRRQHALLRRPCPQALQARASRLSKPPHMFCQYSCIVSESGARAEALASTIFM